VRRLLPLLIACFCALLAPAIAAAEVQTSTAGPTTATISFDRPDPDGIEVTNFGIAVARAGVTYVDTDAPLLLRRCEAPYCLPGGGIDRNSITVGDLDGDGEPEVILDGFTGGAHCCVVTAVLRWNGAGYTRSVRDWGDPGYRLRDLTGDGIAEFESQDPRFSGAFSSYAASGFPAQVIAFRAGRFVDITKTLPAVVQADAKRWKRIYDRLVRKRDPVLGVVAAYVADELRLGNRKAVKRFLAREARARHLRGEAGKARGSAWTKALLRRLDRWGY
jgi:hypothetical protein